MSIFFYLAAIFQHLEGFSSLGSLRWLSEVECNPKISISVFDDLTAISHFMQLASLRSLNQSSEVECNPKGFCISGNFCHLDCSANHQKLNVIQKWALVFWWYWVGGTLPESNLPLETFTFKFFFISEGGRGYIAQVIHLQKNLHPKKFILFPGEGERGEYIVQVKSTLEKFTSQKFFFFLFPGEGGEGYITHIKSTFRKIFIPKFFSPFPGGGGGREELHHKVSQELSGIFSIHRDSQELSWESLGGGGAHHPVTISHWDPLPITKPC